MGGSTDIDGEPDMDSAELQPESPAPEGDDDHDVEEAPGEFTGLVEEYLKLASVPEKEHDDAYQKTERDCRERINRRYWNRLFRRLGEVVGGSPPNRLEFDEADGRLFDFGWVDERLFPAGKLAYDSGEGDPVYEIRDLRAHLAACDAEFLLVSQRAKLAAGMIEVRGKIEEIGLLIAACAAERGRVQAALSPGVGSELAELNKFIDGSTVALITLEHLKKSKGLGGDQVRSYIQLRTSFDRATDRRNSLLKRAGGPARPIAEANRRIYDARLAAVALAESVDKLKVALDAAEKEAGNRRMLRRSTLEERLGEIREDITMCGRWGRTTASPALLQDRELNSRKAVGEAIRRVEDFDPRLFANRKVEREGRPTVVLTPGIGNGSYDFRSNILIVPRTSPRSALESVAFALALYRRDLDKSVGEGKLWRSFLEDIAWGKLGGMPRSVQAQMRSFVRAYTTWATRDAAGHAALSPELRVWFEQNIAPSIHAPMFPREVRGLPASRRDALIEEAGAEPDSAPGAHRLGCLHWMKEDFSRALELFEHAAEFDDGFAPAHWAQAACLRLSPESFKLDVSTPQRLTRARDALKRFTDSAEQSWWTRKAQGISSELGAKLEEMRRATS